MELNNIFAEYFDEMKRNIPYSNQKEYLEDAYRYINIGLSVLIHTRFAEEKTENHINLQNQHLRLLPITIEELYHAISYKNGKEEPFGDEVKEMLLSAKKYIMQRLHLTEKSQVFPIRKMKYNFGMTDFEYILLLLAYAPIYDMRYETVFAFLQGDVRLKNATIRLGANVFQLEQELTDTELSDAYQGNGLTLKYIIEQKSVIDELPQNSVLTLSERMIGLLNGCTGLDKKLETIARYVSIEKEYSEAIIRKDEINQAEKVMKTIMTAPSRMGNILQIYGEYGIGKRYIAGMASKQLGFGIIYVDVLQLLDATAAEIKEIMRILTRECTFLRANLCFYYSLNESEKRPGTESLISSNVNFLIEALQREFFFAIWISEHKADYLLQKDLNITFMEEKILSSKEKNICWKEFTKQYPLSEEVDITLCANQYVLTIGGIKDVLMNAYHNMIMEGKTSINKNHIRLAVGRQSARQLGRSATLVNSVYTWDDLVIEEEQKRQMIMICNQVRYKNIVGEEWGFFKKTAYGRGVCALFYGPPGTGKTMGVQVLANELGLDLYRIDLSQIVSKYIGETEKNISELFEKAKNINALLFFDEADSLFAKRSEVKDSHDRNANAETAHLLQKLEDYEGIAILATNYINNMDDAFKRRIKFMIHFSFPEANVRYQLWNTILPKDVPRDEELDFEFFADKFELSGSSIKEILTTASFNAAADGKGLTNRYIIDAIKINFAKYGKILSDEDFGYLGVK